MLWHKNATSDQILKYVSSSLQIAAHLLIYMSFHQSVLLVFVHVSMQSCISVSQLSTCLSGDSLSLWAHCTVVSPSAITRLGFIVTELPQTFLKATQNGIQAVFLKLSLWLLGWILKYFYCLMAVCWRHWKHLSNMCQWHHFLFLSFNLTLSLSLYLQS